MPLSDIQETNDIIYSFNLIQQPKFARESTNLKRLLHPYPVLTLKVHRKEKDGSLTDITSHSLSQFFLKASILGADGKVLVGNSVISGIHYSLPALSFKDFNQFGYQDASKAPDEPRDNGVIVFIFNELGIVRKGNFRLRFELYKFEFFHHLLQRIPKICKVAEVISNEFKVYGSRQFYKKLNQAKFAKELEAERRKVQFSRILSYLKDIKVLKEMDDSKQTKKPSSALVKYGKMLAGEFVVFDSSESPDKKEATSPESLTDESIVNPAGYPEIKDTKRKLDAYDDRMSIKKLLLA